MVSCANSLLHTLSPAQKHHTLRRFSSPISLPASIPTMPYPQPKSSTLSYGEKSTTDNMANVPLSIELGEKIEGDVSNTISTSLILVEIICYASKCQVFMNSLSLLSYHKSLHNAMILNVFHCLYGNDHMKSDISILRLIDLFFENCITA